MLLHVTGMHSRYIVIKILMHAQSQFFSCQKRDVGELRCVSWKAKNSSEASKDTHICLWRCLASLSSLKSSELAFATMAANSLSYSSEDPVNLLLDFKSSNSLMASWRLSVSC